jgi:hypothetical protein
VVSEGTTAGGAGAVELASEPSRRGGMVVVLRQRPAGGMAETSDHRIRVDELEPRLWFRGAAWVSVSWRRGGRHMKEDTSPGLSGEQRRWTRPALAGRRRWRNQLGFQGRGRAHETAGTKSTRRWWWSSARRSKTPEHQHRPGPGMVMSTAVASPGTGCAVRVYEEGGASVRRGEGMGEG